MKCVILLAFVAAANAGLVPALVNTGVSAQYRSQDNIGNYAFGYNEDHATGGTFRREVGDPAGNKVGSYGLRDADGRLRIVNYVADDAGFRVNIQTNEPGVEPKDPASVLINKAPVVAVAEHAPLLAAPAPVLAAPAPAPLIAAPAAHYAAPAVHYAAPAVQYAAPAVHAPVQYAAPAVHAPVQYAAPAVHAPAYAPIAAPAHAAITSYTNTITHPTYAAAPIAAAPVGYGYGAPLAHGYGAPLAHGYNAGYAAPLAHGYGAPLSAYHGALGYAPAAYGYGHAGAIGAWKK